MSRNLPFYSFTSFSIVSPRPFINKPNSSRDFTIFTKSSITLFEISNVVILDLRFS